MTACERCWGQAFTESRMGPESQVEAYHRILIENEEAHTWDQSQEQAGDGAGCASTALIP
jgi:hypothetical protein